MTFVWPRLLLLLTAIPVLVIAYGALLRRRSRQVADGGLFASSGGPAQRLGRRRHVPIVLYFVAVTLLVFGLSRPQLVLALPRQEGTVILAFDNSNSMSATDAEPTRLGAAQQAAIEFVGDQPDGVQIGVVAFSGGGVTMQIPTDNEADVLDAIERVSIEGTTSLGWGIFAALNAVTEDPIDLASADTGADDNAAPIDPRDIQIGDFGSAIVILLTDGEDTSDLDPADMAAIASNAGVRIFPVGFGDRTPTTIEVDGFMLATALDETLLVQIAEITDGTYAAAVDEELSALYDAVDRRLTVRGEETEITGGIAGLGALVMLLGGALSLRWFGRMP